MAEKVNTIPAAGRVVGFDDNEPTPGEAETNRLLVDYHELADEVTKLLEDARALPEIVTSDEEMRPLADHIVKMRDTTARALTIHKTEKEPHLRRGQAVDAFFFGFRDRLNKASLVLSNRVNTHQQAKLAAERARLRAEQEAAAKAAQEAAEKAARARKAENVERQTITAAQQATIARDAAEQLAAAPAALTRTRFEESQTLVTMREVGFVEITDYDKLPLDLLRPYIPRDALEKAVKNYAKLNDFKVTVPGANIGKKNESVVR